MCQNSCQSNHVLQVQNLHTYSQTLHRTQDNDDKTDLSDGVTIEYTGIVLDRNQGGEEDYKAIEDD